MSHFLDVPRLVGIVSALASERIGEAVEGLDLKQRGERRVGRLGHRQGAGFASARHHHGRALGGEFARCFPDARIAFIV
jgi:hypothetical protein